MFKEVNDVNKYRKDDKIINLDITENLSKKIDDEIKNSEDMVMYSRNSSELEKRLRKLLSHTVDWYEHYVFPEYYDIIKAKVLFAWDIKCRLMQNWDDTQFAEIYPLISSIHDAFHAQTYDLFGNAKAIARNPEDQWMTSKAQDFNDWAESTSDSEDAEEQIKLEASLLWTSYWQFWVQIEKEKNIIYLQDWTEKKTTFDKIKMTTSHVSVFDLFYDPQETDFYKTKRKARRKIIAYEDIESQYWYIFAITDDLKKLILDHPQMISDKDYSKIYQIKQLEKKFLTKAKKRFVNNKNFDDFTFDDLFTITKEQQWCELFEYWHEDKLVILVNWYVVFDWPSPYPTWEDPFALVIYQPVPKSIRGRWIGHLLMNHQKQANTHRNAVQNAVYRNAYPMYIMEQNKIIDPVTNKSPLSLRHKAWKTFIIKEAWIQNWWLRPLTFDNISYIQIAQQALSNITSQSYEIVGISSLLQWWTGKIERVPLAVKTQIGTLKGRLMPMMKSIERFLRKKYNTRLSIGVAVLDSNFVARILTDDWQVRFSEIDLESLQNKFDIVVETEPLRQQTKWERFKQMIELLQYARDLIIDQSTGIPRIDLAWFLNQMISQFDFEAMKILTPEEKKSIIQEQIEIMQYQQSLIQQQAAQQQATQQQATQKPSDQTPISLEQLLQKIPQRKENYKNKTTTWNISL